MDNLIPRYFSPLTAHLIAESNQVDMNNRDDGIRALRRP